MTDKRPTPEAPQEVPQETTRGPRRKKRAAPTIDLTATEVPQAAAAGDAPQQSAAQEPPEPDPETLAATANTGSASSPWRRVSSHITPSTLAAGAAGAAIVALVLFGLWLTGLVPIRYAGSTAMRARVAGLEMQLHDLQNRPAAAAEAKSVDALKERIGKIEDTIGKLPAGDAGVAERIAATDNAMKALGLALAALNRRSDDIAGNAANARERAEAAEKAVTDLRTSMQTLAGSPAEAQSLQQRIAALEQSAKLAREDIAKTAATDTAARLALSAAALRDAAIGGAPFAGELAQAKALGADDKNLTPLAPFVATGVPTPSALAHELRTIIPAMLKASGAQAPAGGFLDRLQANAGKLVRIRPIDAPAGDDASAVLARLEIDAANDDIAGALVDLGKLADATRAPAQAWIAKAQARQAALDAARAFAADAARALGPR